MAHSGPQSRKVYVVGTSVLVIIFALEFLVEPLALVFAGCRTEDAFHFPVGAGLELLDLLFALDEDGQGRRLHATDSGQVEATGLRIEGGHGARAVDADEPVGRFVADLADPDKVMAVLSGGASGRQFDPHLDDQLDAWHSGAVSYWWFSDKAIEEHARHQLRLEP